jgi:hypothetical protein
MSILPADTAPVTLKSPPVTENAPVAEKLGAKVMFDVVVLRPKVIEFGGTGKVNFSNMKFVVLCAHLKFAVD